MNKTFKLQPVGSTGLAILLAIAAFCAAVAAIVWSLRSAQPLVMYIIAFTTLALALLFVWFAYAQGQSRVELSGSHIELRAPIYGRAIPLDRIIPDSIAYVSLGAESPWRLTWRTNGLAVPGYQLGWFTTQKTGKVLAALTSPEAVAFRTRDAYSVLLSVADHESFVQALRASLPPA